MKILVNREAKDPARAKHFLTTGHLETLACSFYFF
jgi:hypothetical protein